GIVTRFLDAQKAAPPESILYPSPDFDDSIGRIARAFSLRIGVYRAVWELISAGELVPTTGPKSWPPELPYRINNTLSTMRFDNLKFHYIPDICRVHLTEEPVADVDIFLRGANCPTLDSGILDAIEQSLDCFRRGLYMPATVMLAAGVEAAWTE